MRRILENWFVDRFKIHYFQQYNASPPVHEMKGGVCIHGHFDPKRGCGLRECYPDASQFITVLRDPMEMALSNYFFWKRKARSRQIRLGMIRPGDPDDYPDLNTFFLRRPDSRMMSFLPEDMTLENYSKYFQERFVWIGLVETLPRDVGVLARKLGFPRTPILHINASPRDESLSPSIAAEFRERNRWAFEMVDFVRSLEMNDEFIQF